MANDRGARPTERTIEIAVGPRRFNAIAKDCATEREVAFMNHPKPEELAEFLYDEVEPSRREEISKHLASCEECAGQIASWRSVRKELAGWKVPAGNSSARSAPLAFAQPIKWAAAAVVFLCVGYGVARVTSPSIDPSKLRADLAKELRSEVRQELASEMTHYSDQQLAQQAEFQQAVAATMNRLAVQQV